jgi:hypothetical protein
VDVGLAQLPSVGVDLERSADLDASVLLEVHRLAAAAEAEGLELHEDVGGEVVIEDRGLDVTRCEARHGVEFPGDQLHLGQGHDLVAVEARGHLLASGCSLGSGSEYGWGLA